MPKDLTVATGMDALTHAIEGYISKGAWPMSDIFTLKAVELIGRSLRKAALENDPEARSSMALGQHLAGMGYSNAGRGVVHSLAHAVGGVYGTSHGLTNGVILPWAMEFNAECTGEKYRDIAKAMGVHGTANMSPEEYRRAAVDAVRQLGADLGVPANLGALGVKAEDVPFLAQQAISDVCTADNPAGGKPGRAGRAAESDALISPHLLSRREGSAPLSHKKGLPLGGALFALHRAALCRICILRQVDKPVEVIEQKHGKTDDHREVGGVCQRGHPPQGDQHQVVGRVGQRVVGISPKGEVDGEETGGDRKGAHPQIGRVKGLKTKKNTAVTAAVRASMTAPSPRFNRSTFTSARLPP